MNDEYYLNEALKEAKKAYKLDEVPIGCVIVYNEKIVARSHNLRENKKSALAHAELIAINKACKKLKQKFLDGATLYVTIEPCIMCSGAIIQSRIKRIVYGAKEPKFGCCESLGNVFNDYKFNHKVEICGGVLENETSSLMKSFFKEKRNK